MYVPIPCPRRSFICFLQYQGDTHPVWASLAADYLPIMAASTSSERAFSSAGITISKRRNRLKADVVEALQFLKKLYKRELVFRKWESVVEELEEVEDDGTPAEDGWDTHFADASDNEEDS